MDVKAKQPYRKPVIERISLVGEMQTTASCKTTSALNTKQVKWACDKSSACKKTIGS